MDKIKNLLHKGDKQSTELDSTSTGSTAASSNTASSTTKGSNTGTSTTAPVTGETPGSMREAGADSTEVDQTVAAPVTNETVTRTNEERVTTAVDKEVHQDHYQTKVQPVRDAAVKEEQHHHNIVPVEHKHFEHDRPADVEDKLAAEAAQFKNTTRTVDGGSTVTAAPTLGREHVHHHVHETIQPVIQKETVEPHITHTHVPIHEVHHNATKHHGTSVLPAMDRSEFEKLTGSTGTTGTTATEPGVDRP